MAISTHAVESHHKRPRHGEGEPRFETEKEARAEKDNSDHRHKLKSALNGDPTPPPAAASGGDGDKDQCEVKNSKTGGGGFGWFGGHCYVFYSGVKTFADARVQCEAAGGHIVTITTASEWGFVVSAMLSLSRASKPGEFDGPWVGYTDVLEEGKWRWITGELGVVGDSKYERWLKDSPGSDGAADCAIASHTVTHEWKDMDCKKKQSVICEYHALPRKRETIKIKFPDYDRKLQLHRAEVYHLASRMVTRVRAVYEKVEERTPDVKQAVSLLSIRTKSIRTIVDTATKRVNALKKRINELKSKIDSFESKIRTKTGELQELLGKYKNYIPDMVHNSNEVLRIMNLLKTQQQDLMKSIADTGMDTKSLMLRQQKITGATEKSARMLNLLQGTVKDKLNEMSAKIPVFLEDLKRSDKEITVLGGAQSQKVRDILKKTKLWAEQKYESVKKAYGVVFQQLGYLQDRTKGSIHRPGMGCKCKKKDTLSDAIAEAGLDADKKLMKLDCECTANTMQVDSAGMLIPPDEGSKGATASTGGAKALTAFGMTDSSGLPNPSFAAIG